MNRIVITTKCSIDFEPKPYLAYREDDDQLCGMGSTQREAVEDLFGQEETAMLKFLEQS